MCCFLPVSLRLWFLCVCGSSPWLRPPVWEWRVSPSAGPGPGPARSYCGHPDSVEWPGTSFLQTGSHIRHPGRIVSYQYVCLLSPFCLLQSFNADANIFLLLIMCICVLSHIGNLILMSTFPIFLCICLLSCIGKIVLMATFPKSCFIYFLPLAILYW